MTEIEQALFHDGTAHRIRSLELSEDVLVLTLSPSDARDRVTRARFESLFGELTEMVTEGES